MATTIVIESIDTTSARITQARSIVQSLCVALGNADGAPSPEVTAEALSGVETLLEQAEAACSAITLAAE
jgi:hypothetical protein